MKKKTILLIVCAVVVLGVAAFFGWRYIQGGSDDGSGVYVQPTVELNMYSAPSTTLLQVSGMVFHHSIQELVKY